MTTETQRASRQLGRRSVRPPTIWSASANCPGRRQRGRIGEVEIVGAGGAKLQIQPGVVAEAQGAGRQFHLALQRARGRRGARNRFEHPHGHVTGGGQAGPGVALVVGDPGQRGETRARGGQVGRTLAVVDR